MLAPELSPPDDPEFVNCSDQSAAAISAELDNQTSSNHDQPRSTSKRNLRRVIIIFLCVLFVIALAIGLVVGLDRAHDNSRLVLQGFQIILIYLIL